MVVLQSKQYNLLSNYCLDISKGYLLLSLITPDLSSILIVTFFKFSVALLFLYLGLQFSHYGPK